MSLTQPVKARTRRLSPKRVFLFTLSPVVVLAAGLGVFIGLAGRVPAGHLASGVRVGSMQVGGMSREEARIALQKLAKQRESLPVLLRLPASSGIQQVWKPSAAQLGLSLDIPATLDAAEKAGQTSLIGQAANALTGAKPAPVAPRPSVEASKLRAYLKKQIARAVNRKAKNAKLALLPKGGYKVLPEKNGLQLDIEASAAAITQAWMTQNTDDNPKPAGEEPVVSEDSQNPKSKTQNLEVELALKVAMPAIRAAMLQNLSELGSFSTRFGGTGASRGSNIALAASHINGTLLAPGEIFSYNKVVGPRVESAGFQDAPVIVKGELVPGIGGGICQVSSTLYNAVLLSDLKIVHRSHHAFPVHYLPAGRDATVVDGAIDFKFQNNTPAPIYIAASSGKGHLAFRILGRKTPGKSVSITLANHEIEPTPPAKTISDPTLYAGTRKYKDKGHRGHRVTVYRVVRENGQVIKKELIARDHYKPFAPIVLVGTKPRPAQTAKKTPALPKTPAAPATPPAVSTPPSNG